jgi:hypothetical protein
MPSLEEVFVKGAMRGPINSRELEQTFDQLRHFIEQVSENLGRYESEAYRRRIQLDNQ